MGWRDNWDKAEIKNRFVSLNATDPPILPRPKKIYCHSFKKNILFYFLNEKKKAARTKTLRNDRPHCGIEPRQDGGALHSWSSHLFVGKNNAF